MNNGPRTMLQRRGHVAPSPRCRAGIFEDEGAGSRSLEGPGGREDRPPASGSDPAGMSVRPLTGLTNERRRRPHRFDNITPEGVLRHVALSPRAPRTAHRLLTFRGRSTGGPTVFGPLFGTRRVPASGTQSGGDTEIRKDHRLQKKPDRNHRQYDRHISHRSFPRPTEISRSPSKTLQGLFVRRVPTPPSRPVLCPDLPVHPA